MNPTKEVLKALWNLFWIVVEFLIAVGILAALHLLFSSPQ